MKNKKYFYVIIFRLNVDRSRSIGNRSRSRLVHDRSRSWLVNQRSRSRPVDNCYRCRRRRGRRGESSWRRSG
jgi:hypothetical protein